MSQKKDDAPLQLATLITMESHRSRILGLIGSLMLTVSGAKNSFVYIRTSRGLHCSASGAISYLHCHAVPDEEHRHTTCRRHGEGPHKGRIHYFKQPWWLATAV